MSSRTNLCRPIWEKGRERERRTERLNHGLLLYGCLVTSHCPGTEILPVFVTARSAPLPRRALHYINAHNPPLPCPFSLRRPILANITLKYDRVCWAPIFWRICCYNVCGVGDARINRRSRELMIERVKWAQHARILVRTLLLLWLNQCACVCRNETQKIFITKWSGFCGVSHRERRDEWDARMVPFFLLSVRREYYSICIVYRKLHRRRNVFR